MYLLKNVNKIKGKISMGKAAITGAFTGFIASIVMWLVASVRVGGFSYELRSAMMQPEFQEAFGDIGASSEWVFGLVLAIMIVITGILFAFFGALGGIISNELVK